MYIYIHTRLRVDEKQNLLKIGTSLNDSAVRVNDIIYKREPGAINAWVFSVGKMRGDAALFFFLYQIFGSSITE